MKEYCCNVKIGVVVRANSEEEAEAILTDRFSQGFGCEVEIRSEEDV